MVPSNLQGKSGPPEEAAAPESRALEATLHDLTNSLAASRSYAEVLRNRARIGALVHPEPVLDYLVEELDRMSEIALSVRRRTRDEANVSLRWASEEIFEPAEGAYALLDLLERSARLPQPLPAGEAADLAARARRHVARILALARRLEGEADGGVVAQTQSVDVEAVVHDVLSGPLATLLEERGAVILREGELPPARGNHVLVARTLEALVSNAVRHNPAPFPEVEIGGRVLGDGDREYWVRDNGPGLPPEMRDAADGPPGGGLAATRRALEAMGGRLVLDTPPLGDGTVARFILPGPRGATLPPGL